MNVLLIIVSLFFIQIPAYAQTAEDAFLKAMRYAQTASPFSNRLNWEDIKAQGLSFMKGREGLCVATSAIANVLVPPLFQQDRHSFVTQDNMDSDNCPPSPFDTLSEAMREWINLAPEIRAPLLEYAAHFHGRRIGAFSYVYVPAGFAWQQEDINKRVQEGRDALKRARPHSSKGIILDFRHNVGGNNVPMLLALSTLLKDNILFKFAPDITVSMDTSGNRLFMNYQGDISEYGRYDDNTPVRRLKKPIVILINGLTGSSGAITAFTLKNAIPNAMLVGENSSDTLSVTESYPLPDGNYFNLMVLRIYNKNNVMEPLTLNVDLPVAQDYTRMFRDTDPQIVKALSILSQ